MAPTGADNVAETIRVNVRAVEEQRRKAGRPMLAFLNHPNFGWGVRAEEMLVEELRYFEVYNGHPSVRNYGDAIHPSTEKMWDIALALRLGKFKMPVLFGLGTDDAHAYHVYGLGKTNPGRGWIMVRAPFLSAETMVKSIEAGDFYVSTGVTLDDVRRENGAIRLKIRTQPGAAKLAMPHMPATGVSGLDLYVKSADGRWRWLAVGFPNAQTNEVRLVAGLPKGQREYLLYLPLYNGVSAVALGVPKQHALANAPPRVEGTDKPIVFYGTSITQGGCASRPGMVHTALLGRWLDRPVINLGFSGNGRMEPELAHLMAELDPCVYVLDCLPNIGANEVSERTEPFVRILRKARPLTPIVLVEDRSYTNAHLLPGPRQRNETSRKALRHAFDHMTKAGVPALHYLEGEALLGDDSEGTVDSSHPSDLGFVRQAEAFAKTLRPILKR